MAKRQPVEVETDILSPATPTPAPEPIRESPKGKKAPTRPVGAFASGHRVEEWETVNDAGVRVRVRRDIDTGAYEVIELGGE